MVCIPCWSTAYRQAVLGSNGVHVCNRAIWYAYHVGLLHTDRLFWGQMACMCAIVPYGMHTMLVYCIQTGCFGVKWRACVQSCHMVCIPCWSTAYRQAVLGSNGVHVCN